MADEKLKPLSPQQERFVYEYMIDFTAKEAYARAGYSTTNSAGPMRIMRNAAVIDAIRKRCMEIQVKLEVNADDVRRGFARIATDPREEHLGGPSWRDRIAAWRELGRLFGMYTNKIQVTGSLTLVDLLLAADARMVETPLLEVKH